MKSKPWSGLLFVLGIFSLLGLFFFQEDIQFSENENRVLQKKPHITWENFVSGKLGEETDAYFADQFPFRETFVGWKTKILTLLGIHENNGVYAGKDMLFQAYRIPSQEDSYQGIKDFISRYQIPVTILAIPTKAAIYQEKLPKYAPLPDEENFLKDLARSLPEAKVISPLHVFLNHKSEKLYYFTDHHWTDKGAYLAYAFFAQENGITPLAYDFFPKKTVPNFHGSLYSSGGYRYPGEDFTLTLPNKIEDLEVDYGKENTSKKMYAMEKLEEKDKYAAYFGGNYPFVKIKTGHAGPKLLLIKDSFANAMVPMLASHYREIHLVDLRYLRSPLSQDMEDYDEVLILYNVKNFVEDEHLKKLGL